MLAEVYLERDEIRHYYRCEVTENLFGDIQLDRRWGRIGQTEHRRTNIFEASDQAINALSRVQFVMERRGYTTLHCDVPEQAFVRMIQRRYFAYLNVKLGCLFADNNKLFHLSERLRPHGIVYAGDLVQLTERQLVFLLSAPNDRFTHLRETMESTVGALQKFLAEYGLLLGATVPGWCRAREYLVCRLQEMRTSPPHAARHRDSDNLLILHQSLPRKALPVSDQPAFL